MTLCSISKVTDSIKLRGNTCTDATIRKGNIIMGMRRMFRRDTEVKMISAVRMFVGLDNTNVANMTKLTCFIKEMERNGK